jgi:hypothetical protein
MPIIPAQKLVREAGLGGIRSGSGKHATDDSGVIGKGQPRSPGIRLSGANAEARAGGTYGYTYNAAGRMDTFSINGFLQAQYKYDAMG